MNIGKVAQALHDRMKNAGGVYNFGNLLDLYSVAASAIVTRTPHGVVQTFDVLRDKFTGDVPSMLLSIGALIFFAGGEAYHQAWKKGFPPNKNWNLTGDLLSGAGAVALGAGLYGIGEPTLAAFSGGLHAASKFGSALGASEKVGEVLDREFKLAGITTTGREVIKDLALVSRAPALLSCAKSIVDNFNSMPIDTATQASLMPIILAWCYLKWAQADSMLTGDKSWLKQTGNKLGKAWEKVSAMPSLPADLPEHATPQELKKMRGKLYGALQWQRIKLLAAFAPIMGPVIVNSVFKDAIPATAWPIILPIMAGEVWFCAKSAPNYQRRYIENKLLENEISHISGRLHAKPAAQAPSI